MSPEEQRIAIAEACGQKYHKPTQEELKSGSYYQYEPDCLTDLNVMHEAEKVLTHEQLLHYQRILCDSVGGPHCALHATAPQRAEAFLRTLGKWKD